VPAPAAWADIPNAETHLSGPDFLTAVVPDEDLAREPTIVVCTNGERVIPYEVMRWRSASSPRPHRREVLRCSPPDPAFGSSVAAHRSGFVRGRDGTDHVSSSAHHDDHQQGEIPRRPAAQPPGRVSDAGGAGCRRGPSLGCSTATRTRLTTSQPVCGAVFGDPAAVGAGAASGR
jgi:hypothetical protein